MRDIIWTIIIIWLVWKIYDAFRAVSKTRTQTQGFGQSNQYNNNNYSGREGDVRVDNPGAGQKTHFKPEDGEYVDYEEVK